MTSMFSSLFSRDPAQSFNYEFGEKIIEEPDKYLWTINKGNKKGTNEAYLILSLDAKYCTEHQTNLGRAYIKRLKTLKHPSVLNYIDSLETDKLLHVVTEEAVPLEIYLRNKPFQNDEQKDMAISWGIFQITSALKFLNQEANLSHNNLHSASIFVTKNGEWKIGGVEYMSPCDGYPPTRPYELERYDPPENKAQTRAREPWSCDVWGLACLIWESFNGPLPNTAALKSGKKIPKSWHQVYASLITANPKKRPSPEDILRDGRKGGAFLKNKFVDTLLFLEEFQLREAREKAAFFNHLKDNLDLFPEDVAKNKILPRLIEAYQYGDAGSSVLTPLFRIGRTLNDEEYQSKIVPCIVQLFSSNDRSTRVKLLEKIEEFGPHLNKNVVNEKIFGNLTSGFLDTNPAVREATVKAMVYLAPKLNKQNLDIELMKHLARLQSKDNQPGIRTNTTICLGKIGVYLDPRDRQKILVSAFTRALKDPFPPARVSGVLALSATQQYYQLIEIANRILPCLCPLTFDPEKNVREQAFKAINGFVQKMEKASENPDLIESLECEVQAGAGAGALSPDKVPQWASWALGAISGKFYKAPASAAQPTEPAKIQVPSTKIGELNLGSMAESRDIISEHRVADDEGWGDDDEEWGDIEDTTSPAETKMPIDFGMAATRDNGTKSDWGDSWTDESTDKKHQSTCRSGGMKLGSSKKQTEFDEIDFLNEFEPQQNKLSSAGISASTAFGPSGPIRTSLGKKKAEPVSDGWDDFGSDGNGDTAGWGSDQWQPTQETANEKKRALAEKQAQKKAELEERRKNRAMKLGTRKL